jgi:hypothetical protein
MNYSTTFRKVFKNRMLMAWTLWACSMMSNAAVGVVVETWLMHEKSGEDRPLRDIGFKMLPFIRAKSLGFSIPDLCSLLSASSLALALVMRPNISCTVIILRRILVISAVAYLGRALSIPMTLLPNPDPDCTPILLPQSLLLSILLIPIGSTVTCSDVFYSGHTIPITCAILTWVYYLRTYPILQVCGILVSVTGLLGIIMTHFHYTLDVFYGYMITWGLWESYHFALRCPSVLYYFPTLVWFESGDALSANGRREIQPGVFNIEWSVDPRLTWSYASDTTWSIPKPVSQSQILLLLVVALTLSPSWIAIYNGGTNCPPS